MKQLVAGLLVVGSLMACGGSEEDYSTSMTEACTQLSTKQREVQGEQEGRAAVRAFADTADDLEPPDDVADAHGQLVSAVRTFLDQAEQLDSGDIDEQDVLATYREASTAAGKLNIPACASAFPANG